ncbi:FCD domain-containing protein [Croceicoccus estronivorus]|uniref:FCD domain-containing protein n=1 Tax=Croceicoccus estronivorus TaxID=1172626 RepID=UPI001F2C633D|nr:FCD domain-containing protein [Croceicoccus estronivorus]
MDVLDVAEDMTAFVLKVAAKRFDMARHDQTLNRAQIAIATAAAEDEIPQFSRARRKLYRAFLEIGGNRELQRLYPAIGMHIVHAQFPTPKLRGIRLADYEEMIAAVRNRDSLSAEQAGIRHVENVRAIVIEQLAGSRIDR